MNTIHTSLNTRDMVGRYDAAVYDLGLGSESQDILLMIFSDLVLELVYTDLRKLGLLIYLSTEILGILLILFSVLISVSIH